MGGGPLKRKLFSYRPSGNGPPGPNQRRESPEPIFMTDPGTPLRFGWDDGSEIKWGIKWAIKWA